MKTFTRHAAKHVACEKLTQKRTLPNPVPFLHVSTIIWRAKLKWLISWSTAKRPTLLCSGKRMHSNFIMLPRRISNELYGQDVDVSNYMT